MSHLLVENHLRKRARLSKDLNFKHDIYEPNIAAFGNADSTIEEFIDSLAAAFDPTYNANNPTQGSMYLDYVIDNIKRGIINLNAADSLRTRRVLQGYMEDQSSPHPRLQKELQRYYRDIPSLEAAISSALKINAAELIADPRYIAYYTKEGTGAYGGLTERTFYDTLADLFDPSPNQRYMKYIINNLLPSSDSKGKVIPPNITKEESAMVKSVLAAHMSQVENGNSKIKQDVARFYPKIKFDLINALKPYMIDYNTTDNTTDAFVITKDMFTRHLGAPVYQNDKHLFYFVRDANDAKKVISTKTSDRFNEFRRHCTGYWCVSEMPSYFPIYLTVDVYGFVDFAIVPKPSNGYSYGELKNRFNSPNSAVLMNNEDYESLLNFFLSDEAIHVKRLYNQLDLTGSSDNLHNDYFKFLLRSKDVDTIEKLTGKKFNSAEDFIRSVFGANRVYDLDAYANTILPRYRAFQLYFNLAPDNFPLFAAFKGKAPGDTTGTVIDSSSFADTIFESWKNDLQKLISSYIKDKSKSLATTDNIKELTDIIYGSTAQQIKRLSPNRYNKVIDIVSKKIEDGTVRIDGSIDVYTIAKIMNMSPLVKPIADATQKQLAQYLKLGGVTSITYDNRMSFPYDGFASVTKLLGPDISNKSKLHMLKVYFDVFKRDVESHSYNQLAAASRAASVLKGVQTIAKNLKIEEGSIAIAFARSLNDAIQNGEQISDLITVRIYHTFKKYYDDRIKAFDRETPHFIKHIARADSSSSARILYANKFIDIKQEYLPPSSRLQIFKKFANDTSNATFDERASTIEITGRDLDNIVSIGSRYRIKLKTTKWRPIESLITSAAADARSLFRASIPPDHFNRIRDAINQLINNYEATPIALYVTSILSGYLIDSSEKLIRAYKSDNCLLTNLTFFIVVKLKNGRTVAINERGLIHHGFTAIGRGNGTTFESFQQSMDTYARLYENRLIKVRSFDNLFERVEFNR